MTISKTVDLSSLVSLCVRLHECCQSMQAMTAGDAVDYGYTDGAQELHEAIVAECQGLVFAAAPRARQPAVPDWLDPHTNNGDWRADAEYRMGWNACRDAMLKGGAQITGTERCTKDGGKCAAGGQCDACGAAQQPAVPAPGAVRELISGVRSINRAKHHVVKVSGDDEPCYYQRSEWIEWVLELADRAEQAIAQQPDGEGK